MHNGDYWRLGRVGKRGDIGRMDNGTQMKLEVINSSILLHSGLMIVPNHLLYIL